MQAIISAAISYVVDFFSRDSSGHDAAHTMRVYRMALRLAKAEGADEEIAGLAALLHDVDDRKISPQTHGDCGHAVAFLRGQGMSEEIIARVVEIIRGVSFSENAGKIPASLEGCVVQDADRLDAIGAIGIGRTFAYGGSHGRRMEDSVAHFHEKLLRLMGMMTTEEGRRIARARHAYMEAFLEEYRAEEEGLR